MSKIILAGGDDGTGSVTVQAPATGSNRVLTLEDADGTLSPLVLGTAQTASGTSVNFTGIPSWVKRITIMISGVSVAATSTAYIRVGTAGTLETTGYNGITAAGGSVAAITNNMGQVTFSAGSSRIDGHAVISKLSENTWTSMCMLGRSGSETILQSTASSITLSGTLDTVGLVLVGSTFDAGEVNIMYE